jgi:hypothetical protein
MTLSFLLSFSNWTFGCKEQIPKQIIEVNEVLKTPFKTVLLHHSPHTCKLFPASKFIFLATGF